MTILQQLYSDTIKSKPSNILAYSISQEICTRYLLCCGYTLTDFPISIRLTSLALWQSNDCPSASKATLMNMEKYFMWIHYERLHNHNKAKHNKTVCIFLGIYCNTLRIEYIKICTRFMLCCVLLWSGISRFIHILQGYSTDTRAIIRLFHFQSINPKGYE